MNAAEFETAFERLAAALDTLGPSRESDFLVRLVLLLAQHCPDLATFEQALAAGVAVERGRE